MQKKATSWRFFSFTTTRKTHVGLRHANKLKKPNLSPRELFPPVEAVSETFEFPAAVIWTTVVQLYIR